MTFAVAEHGDERNQCLAGIHLGSIACVISAFDAVVVSCVGFEHLFTALFSTTILANTAMTVSILDWINPAALWDLTLEI
jgi:hypothetical protein